MVFVWPLDFTIVTLLLATVPPELLKKLKKFIIMVDPEGQVKILEVAPETNVTACAL